MIRRESPDVEPVPIQPEEQLELPEPAASSAPSIQANTSTVQKVALVILAAVATAWMLQWAQAVFIPLVISILISFALSPLVDRLQAWRVPRLFGAAIVLTILLLVLGFMLTRLQGQIVTIVERLPVAAEEMRERLRASDGGPGPIQKVRQTAEELEKVAKEMEPEGAPEAENTVRIEQPALEVWQFLQMGTAGLTAAAGWLLIVVFLVYFLLVSDDLFKRKLVKIVGPSMSNKRVTMEIVGEIEKDIERFLWVQLLTMAIVAAASWAAFQMIGLEQAAVWGIAAGVLNIIPYFGPLLVACGIAVVALLQFGAVGNVLMVVGISLAITSLEGYLLTPYLMGRAGRMNAVAVFVGLLFWGFLWGVAGAVLAVPMLMFVKAICDRIEPLQPVGELLGD